jgi:hypothetical protein
MVEGNDDDVVFDDNLFLLSPEPEHDENEPEVGYPGEKVERNKQIREDLLAGMTKDEVAKKHGLTKDRVAELNRKRARRERARQMLGASDGDERFCTKNGCSARMVPQLDRWGRRAFWGCSRFPECRGHQSAESSTGSKEVLMGGIRTPDEDHRRPLSLDEEEARWVEENRMWLATMLRCPEGCMVDDGRGGLVPVRMYPRPSGAPAYYACARSETMTPGCPGRRPWSAVYEVYERHKAGPDRRGP